MFAPWEKSYDQPKQHIKKQRHYFANKGPSSQGYGFSSGHVWMWKLDYKESWVLKNWCFWIVVLEKTLESPLDCKEIQPVHPKGNQSWIFTGRTEAEAETPILWPPNAKNWLDIRKGDQEMELFLTLYVVVMILGRPGDSILLTSKLVAGEQVREGTAPFD